MTTTPVNIDYNGIQINATNNDTSTTLTMNGSDKGLILEYDKNSINPKTFKITPSGVEWNDGSSTYTTGLGRLCAVEQVFQAVELPPNATTLSINNTILVQDHNYSTITASLFTDNSTAHLDLTDGTNYNQLSSTEITISDNIDDHQTHIDNQNVVCSANGNEVIISNGTGSYPFGFQVSNGSQTLQIVPTGINVTSTNLNISGGDLTLSSNNIYGVNNINLNTINGYYPTTIGLTWSDFNANNAYNQLPSNSYQLNNASYQANYTTTQSNLQFTIYNSNTGNTTTLEENTLSTSNQDLTINAGSGSNNINLECNSLTINGNPLPTGSIVYSFPEVSVYIGNGSVSSPVGSVNIPTGTYTITYTITFDAGAFNQSAGSFNMIKGCVGLYSGGTGYLYPNGYSGNYLPSTLITYDSSYPCSITAVDTISISSGGTFQMFGFQLNNQSSSGNITISATLVLQ